MVIIMTIIRSMKTRILATCHMAAALGIGCLLYLFLREGTYLHQILHAQGIWSRTAFFGDRLFRYYLPDFLWGYALSMGLYALYPPQGKRSDLLPALTAAVVGGAYEIAQWCGWVRGTGDVVDGLLYLYAAVAAYKIISLKEERKHMKRVLALIMAVLMIATFTVFALGSGSSEETDQGTDAAGKTEAPEVAGCTVDIKSSRLAKDYEGKDIIIVKYAFTNNEDEDKNFSLAFDDKAFQNGVGLNKCYVADDSANYSGDNQTKDIKKGATLEVEVAYVLNDSTTDVEVEVSALFSFSDSKVTKTFSIA